MDCPSVEVDYEENGSDYLHESEAFFNIINELKGRLKIPEADFWQQWAAKNFFSGSFPKKTKTEGKKKILIIEKKLLLFRWMLTI